MDHYSPTTPLVSGGYKSRESSSHTRGPFYTILFSPPVKPIRTTEYTGSTGVMGGRRWLVLIINRTGLLCLWLVKQTATVFVRVFPQRIKYGRETALNVGGTNSQSWELGM